MFCVPQNKLNHTDWNDMVWHETRLTWEWGAGVLGTALTTYLSVIQLLSLWCLLSFILRFWNHVFTFEKKWVDHYNNNLLKLQPFQHSLYNLKPVCMLDPSLQQASSSLRAWGISGYWTGGSEHSSAPQKRQPGSCGSGLEVGLQMWSMQAAEARLPPPDSDSLAPLLLQRWSLRSALHRQDCHRPSHIPDLPRTEDWGWSAWPPHDCCPSSRNLLKWREKRKQRI